jgi:tol-pal system protein YbgF
VASKSDIRLLQDEMRATRAQLAVGDSSILRADDARRQQIGALQASVARMNDSVRAIATRLAAFQATSTGEFDAVNRQIVQMQALLGQTTRNLQDTRAQIEVLQEQARSGASGLSAPGTSGAPPVAPTPGDSAAAAAAAAGIPGPATLYTSAVESLNQGAYSTARRAFEQLLASYPNYEQAPRALLRIGDTYKSERNTAAADSVYQLVASRYPKSDEAATGLYLHGKALWDANNKSDARTVLRRVIRDYPTSDAATLAKDLIGPRT